MEELMLYVRYQAKPGCREKFVRQLVEEGILTLIRQEDGCLAYDYYFSAQDENELLLIERWQSAEHQRVHMQQPHMARLRELGARDLDDLLLDALRADVPADGRFDHLLVDEFSYALNETPELSKERLYRAMA